MGRPPSILAVYAHPDDELFHGGGMLAHVSRQGVRVTLACATRGDAGKAHPSVGPVADLGAFRWEELRRSCAIFGLAEPVFLGFNDSARKERLRHGDPRALANADMLDVEASIRHVIEQVRPHVIITFDPHGGYYHPDHLAVHRATTAAFISSGVLETDAPSRLFYSSFSERAYREHAEATRGWGIVDDLDPTVFAVRPTMAALTFDARPYMDLKLAAFAAHRSAFGVSPEMLADPPPEAAARLRGFRPLFEEEVFVLAATRAVVPRWPLAGLFDGLEPASFSLNDGASNPRVG